MAFGPVDARGLVATAPMGNASQRSPGGLGIQRRNGDVIVASFSDRRMLSTRWLPTGGNLLTPMIYRPALSALSGHVELLHSGYYSTNTARDGKLRRVKITLKHRSADLAYRESYYADKDFSKYTAADKERQLEEALMLGNPITDLTVVMELNYFRLNNAEYYIPLAVKIPGNELVLAQKEGADRTIIDFIGEVKDESGTTMTNIRDKVEIKLKGEAAARFGVQSRAIRCGIQFVPGASTRSSSSRGMRKPEGSGLISRISSFPT